MTPPKMSLFLLGAVLLGAVSTPARSAPTSDYPNRIFVEVTGAQQGVIPGDSTELGFENLIDVLDYHHLVHEPPAEAPRGERVIFSKHVDSATRDLWQALDRGELLTLVFRMVYVAPEAGAGSNTRVRVEIDFRNARIVGIEPLGASERIRFVYGSMTVRHCDGASCNEEAAIGATPPE